jgi:hemoglobin
MRIAIFVMALVAACGSKPKGGDTIGTGGGGPSLYDRLGKQDAIKKLVDVFVANVGADPRILEQFKSADTDHLKQMLVDQLCAETGGPCKYTGKTMKDVHQGKNIKDADFDAIVEDLKKALDTLKVPAKEQGELLDAVGKMKPDIVTAQ